jgi:hypothetical protein
VHGHDKPKAASAGVKMMLEIRCLQARRLMAIFNHQCEIDFNVKTMPPIKMGKGQSWPRTRVILAVF